MNHLHIPCEVSEVSDGYHTFDELYDHRIALFLALMACNPKESWMSGLHHDGTMMTGWFIAGMQIPVLFQVANKPTWVESHQITYHLPTKMWDAAMETGAKVLPTAPEWDGHTPANVVFYLHNWVRFINERRVRCQEIE